MKRTFLIFLLAVVIASFVACKNNDVVSYSSDTRSSKAESYNEPEDSALNNNTLNNNTLNNNESDDEGWNENGWDDTKDESHPIHVNRTRDFYAQMSNGVFWYDATMVAHDGTTYSYSQATDGVTVTTIVDKTGTANDSYEIFYNGNEQQYVHKLDIPAKKYDTYITDHGQAFFFDGYEHAMLVKPISGAEEQLGDNTYYCETFLSNASADASAIGYDKYYYKGGKLYAVVTPTTTLYFNNYSTEIPENIYFEAPKDFKAGMLVNETEIDFDDWFLDM